MNDPSDSDEEESAPKPFVLTVASLVTSSVAFLEATSAEATILFVRRPQPTALFDFHAAMEHARWAFGYAYRQSVTAIEAGRLVLAIFLLVASLRVFFRPRGAGWMWRNALMGNVIVTLVAAWWERAHIDARVEAFRATLRVATVPITSPDRTHSADEMFRLSATAASWLTGLFALMLLFTLSFASSERVRAVTD